MNSKGLDRVLLVLLFLLLLVYDTNELKDMFLRSFYSTVEHQFSSPIVLLGISIVGLVSFICHSGKVYSNSLTSNFLALISAMWLISFINSISRPLDLNKYLTIAIPAIFFIGI